MKKKYKPTYSELIDSTIQLNVFSDYIDGTQIILTTQNKHNEPKYILYSLTTDGYKHILKLCDEEELNEMRNYIKGMISASIIHSAYHLKRLKKQLSEKG